MVVSETKTNMNHSQPTKSKLQLQLLLLTCCWIGLGAQAQQGTASGSEQQDQLALSRELLNKYYESEKLLGQEQADWRLGKELLVSRVDLMEAQLKELVTKTAEEKGKITESDSERQKLDVQNQELSKTQDLQLNAVEKAEERVRQLWPMLPEILQTKVRGQFERLPKKAMPRADIKSSVGERFLNVLAILNEATKFHSDVVVVNERRKLKNGQELEVETIYFGLAVGYFAGADLTKPMAGMLLPGKDGWETIEMPESAVQISDVIAMNKSAKLAGFVPLPVKIR
jgi:hypothetical protein